ncbi:YhgE/Pip family protein, partial [Corynebacterium striatum]
MLIVFLLVAPVILAATMMWAMWDPSKYMRQIDLAVVNEDAGVEKQGKYVNYGDQVVEGLLETDYLNFAEMNAQEANDGLLKGKYLMVVTIPKVFSEQAVTIISDKPVKPQIHFASCQMRVLGTGVPETRYCRVPGSWYRGRADGVGPAVLFIRPVI